ncbi:glycosyltransferase [Fuerstiella marisgermanici]|uniref:N-acetylgalactosamine-N, N'-diacetylbacillosaminyl-diphospho-undecaprenol 4-alpha-N-acetylgalactosaminyltransferase n=1 Tax=Fuerstiella marisgermanici TaxID=1891926 RepID=A0A1P8WSM3_9PLAN|nr:glycosyltransferase [Fuerstiella marisgermanici]APZ97054.1 N-acetylgalactosamine-N,N'-diacetylbacillosaminyl-diphospho-undecaprenol 4-alpha-N-acetylgalactosaminyltransferase [Fuerstiella marisgermanici]
MSRIKVVFSIGAMHGGGSERQLVSLLRNLDREKFEPLLYLIYRTGPLLNEIPDDVAVTSFEERFGKPRGPGFLMHRKRVADMSRFLVESGAHISYDRTFLMTLIAADAAQRVGVPNVSTIVTDPPVGFPLVAGRFQFLKKRILRRLYKQSDRVLANSHGAARSAERFYGLPQNSVDVLYNGVDTDHVRQKAAQPITDEWWNQPAAQKPLLRIVTAGRLDEKKSFHLLIAALAQLQNRAVNCDLRLAILGEGPSRERLQAQIQDAELGDVIRLTGFQPNAPAWYRSADLFVLPSLLEGMPNVLLEAMASETPVLSTDCKSGPREILGDNEYGRLCEPDSVDSLAAGIQEFIDHAETRNRYTSIAKDRVTERFSIQTATRSLEEIMSEIVQRRRQGKEHI